MLSILVIEDSPVNMALTTAILENAGHVILQAETASAGIELARRQHPDLVLMDLQLPDIDGLAATRMLKADRRTSDIPVIALTAHAMAGDRERALEAGCDDYDTKPIEFPRLLTKIESLVAKQSAPARGKDHA